MKQLIFVCTIALFASCNNAGSSETKKDSAATASTETSAKKPLPDMPYQLDRPYQNWQPGDPQHAVTVMNSLKGFETNDIPKCMAGFADTVRIRFDGMEGTFSKDSLGKMFAQQRALFTSFSVKMNDWESVISDDKKEEWVTLWYKQYFTGKNGKMDSSNCINDAMIKNGKIAELNEAVRHYAAK